MFSYSNLQGEWQTLGHWKWQIPKETSCLLFSRDIRNSKWVRLVPLTWQNWLREESVGPISYETPAESMPMWADTCCSIHLSLSFLLLFPPQFLCIPRSCQPWHPHASRLSPGFLQQDSLIIPIDNTALIYTTHPGVHGTWSGTLIVLAGGDGLLSIVSIGSCYAVHIDHSKTCRNFCLCYYRMPPSLLIENGKHPLKIPICWYFYFSLPNRLHVLMGPEAQTS